MDVHLNIQQPAGRPAVRRRHSMSFTTNTKLINDCEVDLGRIKTVSKDERYYRKKQDMTEHCMDDHTKIKKKLNLQVEGIPGNYELFDRRALSGQPKEKSSTSTNRIRAARRQSFSGSGFRTDVCDKMTVAEPEDDDFVGFFQWSKASISNAEEAEAAKTEFKKDHRRYSLKHRESVFLVFSSASDWEVEENQEEERGDVLDLGELCDAVDDEWDKRNDDRKQLFFETPHDQRCQRRNSMEHFSLPFRTDVIQATTIDTPKIEPPKPSLPTSFLVSARNLLGSEAEATPSFRRMQRRCSM